MVNPIRPRPVAIAVAAFGLGVTAGMRSQLPLALLAVKAERTQMAGSLPPPLHLLHHRGVVIGLGLSAVGEMVVDKSPMVPSRLGPGPLLGRLGFGAVAGGVLARGAGNRVWIGGMLGAIGALSGSLAGYTARVEGHKATGLSDMSLAVLEDLAAVAIGLLCLDHWSTPPDGLSALHRRPTVRP